MKNSHSPNLILGLLLSIALFLFFASLYFQFIVHLEPCPLCVAQRISLLALVLLFFWAFFIKTKNLFIINSTLQLLFALFGASMAGRQIWLMHIPPAEQPGCVPDISILWHYLPFSDLLKVFLNGTGSCVENVWTWLGITMPEWTLGFFIFFILASIGLTFIHKKNTPP